MESKTFFIFPCILVLCFGYCSCFPPNMLKKDCDALWTHFMRNNSKGLEDGAIFLSRLDTYKEKNMTKLVLSQIVSKYLTMLKSLNIPSIQRNIDNIREELSKVLNDILKSEDQLIKDLTELQALEMGDAKIQQKAAMELFGVFQKIATLNTSSVKRKRNNERRKRGSRN